MSKWFVNKLKEFREKGFAETERQFIDAVKSGDVENVDKLCRDEWIDKEDNDGLRPIHWACARGHVAVVQLLLDRGCQSEAETKDGSRLIHIACSNGHADVVQFLLNTKCHMEVAYENGWLPIHLACAKGHIAVVQLLLDKCFQIEAETKLYRWRPIHLACSSGHVSVVQLLLIGKCQMEIADEFGWLPIHWACANGHAAVVQSLIDSGCQTESENLLRWRPIHFACDRGNCFIVQLLLDRNCQMEAETKDGWRPIHLACDKGHADVVQLLLNGGCVIDAQTKEGKSPVDLASKTENKCAEIIHIAKADRRNTEYSVWHFNDVSVIIRKFKIFSISSVIKAVKESILPIDGPVILFGIEDFIEDCYKKVVGSGLRLVSNKFRYNENVVVDQDEKVKDVLIRLQKRRRWHGVLRYPGTAIEVPPEMTVVELLQANSTVDVEFEIEATINWMDTSALSVNYCDNTPFPFGIHYADELFVCCNDDRTMTQMKAAITFVFQRNLLYGMNQNIDEDKNSNYFLERLATNNADLLQFFSCNKSVRGCTRFGDLLDKQAKVLIHQKVAFSSIDFILKPEETVLREMSGPLQKPFVLKPIFPYHPLILAPSSRHLTVDEVLAALKSHLQTKVVIKKNINLDPSLQIEEVILLHNGQILKGIEILPTQTDSVIDYATIYRCPKLSEKTLIGQGGFGTVYKCKETNSDFYALKVMSISSNSKSFSDMEFDVAIIRELIIAAKVPAHNRIMSYQAFYKENYTFGCHLYISMPLMEGSLSKLLILEGSLAETDIRHFSKQILLGLEHLHENKVIHKNLKGSNVLIDKDRNVKLCDFGLSKHLNDSTRSEETLGQVRLYGWTPNWMAPETMRYPFVYGIQADVWSFGATVVEMIAGQAPYPTDPKFKVISKITEEGVIEHKPLSSLSHELKSFAYSCLENIPNDRPSCEELLQHPFFRQ